jgi:hypothetical protein
MARFDGLRLWWPWLFSYVLLLVAVVVAMFRARESALEQLATPKSQAEWQLWRDDVRRQQDRPGPVQRRVPKSTEPPALVMMRDHFFVSLCGAVLFSTMLYWVCAWFLMGMIKSTKSAATVEP